MTGEGFTEGGVVVGSISGGTWSASFGLSLMELALSDVHDNRRLFGPGCGFLSKRAASADVPYARNAIAKDFLGSTRAEWLLTLDADMGFDPSLMDGLVSAAVANDLKVLGALCFSLDSQGPGKYHSELFGIHPTIFDWVHVKETGERGFTPRHSYAPDEINPCDATGAAATLVHREVLETISAKLSPGELGPYDPIVAPDCEPGGGPRRFSEDLSFCIRASAAGFDIAVHAGIKTSHDKGGVYLTEDEYLRRHGGGLR